MIILCYGSIKKIMINAYKVLQEPYAFSEHILDENKKWEIIGPQRNSHKKNPQTDVAACHWWVSLLSLSLNQSLSATSVCGFFLTIISLY